MTHEPLHELLALRLYGEIEPEEERELARHLESCGECARFARELESGLGRARGLQAHTSAGELPAGWEQGLSEATRSLRRRNRARELLLVGAGLAAGIAAMLLVSSWRATREGEPRVARLDPDAPAFLRFQGDAPPPPATAGGPATRFTAWQAR